MTRRKRFASVAIVAAILGGLVLTSPEPTAAAVKTDTSGRITRHDRRPCGSPCQLFTYENARFRGRTSPSRAGQHVYFHWRRAGSSRWRVFKTTNVIPGCCAFYVLNGGRPRDAIDSEGRWAVPIMASHVRGGRYDVRARFAAQDGYGASQVIRRVRVVYAGDV